MEDSKAPQLQRVMAIMIVVPFIFMALRFYCRWSHRGRFGWDDAVLLLSWALHVAYCGVVIAATKYGLGSHIETISHQDLVSTLRLLYMGNFFVIWAISISKTSFAMTLLALVVRPWHIWALWFSIITVNVIMGLDAIFQFTQCTPLDKTWDPQLEGTCWDTHIVIYFSMFAGAWSALIDFLLAIVPWLVFWDVKMLTPEKIGLIIAMSLGVFSGITASIKTAYLPDLGRWTDLTYSTADLLMWAAAETAVIIIGASIPFMRQFARRFFRGERSTTNGYGNSRAAEHWSSKKDGTSAVRLGSMTVKSNGFSSKVRKADDGSDKSILSDRTGAAGGIMVSQQFTVQIDSEESKEPSPGRDQW